MTISEDIAGKVLDAYKAHPLLGALFMLNVITFVGFGWYLWDKDTKTARFVMQMQSDMKDVRIEAMRAALECAKPAPQPQYILPQAQIPHQAVPLPTKRPK